MNDSSLVSALDNSSVSVADEFVQEIKNFLTIIDAVAESKVEESVPAEMMQVFTDEQWMELIFEFQAGATLFSANYDVALLHQNWMETAELVAPESEGPFYWLIFKDQEGLIVKMLVPQEFQALDMAANGQSFSKMASSLWPDLVMEDAQHEMTEMLMVWLEDGLIIDAGVPLPEDAEYEQD